MSIEHRKQKRVILKKEVTINNSLRVMGLDLSEGGLYLHTGRSIRPGTTVDIALPLDEETLRLKAVVQHSEDGVGMGVMFLNLSRDQLLSLRGFIDDAAEPQSEVVRKKVLVVDDNEMNRRMNKSRLVLDGFMVLEAGDGTEAISVLEKEEINLVVLDLYMVKLDGFKVLSIMRQKPEWKDIPVIVFSGRSNPNEIDRAMAAGATEFLYKMTTTPIKLSERVKRYLSSK